MELIPLVNMILFPAPVPSYTAKDEGVSVTEDGDVRLMISTGLSRRLVIWSHGNAMDIGQLRPIFQYISEEVDADVLAYEYPGYGIAPGRSNRWSIAAVAERTLRWAESRYDEIILVGNSLGTGPATYQATLAAGDRTSVRGLVLISPYISIDHVVADINRLSWWASWLAPTFFDNRAMLKQIGRLPVLIQHGVQDWLIDIRHARELSTLGPTGMFRLMEYPERGHNMLNGQVMDDLIASLRSGFSG